MNLKREVGSVLWLVALYAGVDILMGIVGAERRLALFCGWFAGLIAASILRCRGVHNGNG